MTTTKPEDLQHQPDTPEPVPTTEAPQPGPIDAEMVAEEAADDSGRIAELEAALAEAKDQMLRAVAEADNVRRRTQRELEDRAKYAVQPLAADLLAVADNLRRALDSVAADARQANEQMNNLCVGVEMVEKAFQDALAKNGVSRIEAQGQPFDPRLHEALFEISDPSQPQGTVLQVLEAGYMIRDRLLRPSKVGVSKDGPKREAAPRPEGGEAKPGQQKAYGAKADAAGGNLDTEL